MKINYINNDTGKKVSFKVGGVLKEVNLPIPIKHLIVIIPEKGKPFIGSRVEPFITKK